MAIWREVTFAIESQGAKELVIEDNRADVILDPLRWRILEILEEGKSVTEISDALDVTDARVLYHVQRLEETGVVRLEGDGGGGSPEMAVSARGGSDPRPGGAGGGKFNRPGRQPVRGGRPGRGSHPGGRGRSVQPGIPRSE